VQERARSRESRGAALHLLEIPQGLAMAPEGDEGLGTAEESQARATAGEQALSLREGARPIRPREIRPTGR